MRLIGSYICDQILWKIHPNTTENLLCVEIRNSASFQVFYEIIEIHPTKGLSVMQRFTNENWWTTVAEFCGSVLIIHAYDASFPAAKVGLKAYKIPEGNLLWQHPKAVWHGWEQGQPLVKENCSTDMPSFLDVNAGKMQKEMPDQTFLILPKRTPLLLMPSDPLYESVKTLISQYTQQDTNQWVEYLEHLEYLMVSFTNTHNVQYLLIINTERKLILYEKLAEGTNGYAGLSFYLLGNYLYFLINKNEIKVYTFDG